MVAVRLLRTFGYFEEEYGRIAFDGQKIYNACSALKNYGVDRKTRVCYHKLFEKSP